MTVLLAAAYNRTPMNDAGWNGRHMMGPMGGAFPVIGIVVWVITWVAVVSVLFALARLLWRKGSKVK